MKHTLKRLMGLLLTLCLMMNLTPVWASEDREVIASGQGSWSNPLYPAEPVPAENQIQAEAKLAPSLEGKTFVSISDGEKQLRDHMKNRETTFYLYIYAPSGQPDLKEELMPAAYSEALAVGVNTGDYLRWSWRSSNWNFYVYPGNRYVYEVTMTYYTTAAQEQQFLSDLSALMEELDLWEVSDYGKYCGIYDYITGRVDYAMEELSKGGSGLIFTAYGAMTTGRAVCQGYATLLYAMCRSMGLPVRIITGSSHAWNIAAIHGVYYNLDATWDGQGTQSFRDNFLRGSDNFTDHASDAEYLSASFLSAYPISRTDYAPTAADAQTVCRYRDVSPDSYYYDAVNRVTEYGLFNGTSSYTFTPEGTMTRAMLVTVLWRMAGSPDQGTASGFQDVSSGSYYARAVTWAKNTGIAAGISSTQFGPSRTLTREQAAVFLYRYAAAMGYRTSAYNNLAAYRDISKAGSYAIPALRWVVGAGIMNGVSATQLDPTGSATRGQMAVIMDRFMQYYQLY